MSKYHTGPSAILPVFLSFFVAFILTAMPLPDMLMFARPEWVVLVVFYWTLYLPTRFGISVAWFVGLMLDVLDGNLLGLQAISTSGVAYIVLVIHQRLKLYPLPHQSIVVFLVVGLHLAFVHWAQGLTGIVSSGYAYLTPAISSAAIWTVVAVLLLTLQRAFRVN